MHLEILILITIPLLGLIAFSSNGIWKRYEQVHEIQATEEIMAYANKASAMSQMDIVTQSNAAAAEEESSASQELKMQAVQMDQLVCGLDVLVNGAS